MHHIPNSMTLLRMLLILPLGWLIWQEEWTWVFWIFVAAGFSDLLDGFLARNFDWETPFGRFIDPMADKILCGGLILILAYHDLFPMLVTLLVVVRELAIVGGLATFQYLFGKVEMQPLAISKFNTGVLIAVLIMVLAELAKVPWVQTISEWLLDPWGYVVLGVSLITSGIAYVVIWSRKAREAWRNQNLSESEGS